jgi:hypothetical protein
MIEIKEKTAALVILIYTIVLALGTTFGAILGGNFSIMSLPIYLIMFVGPAIGIMKKKNWCRIFLGCWFTFVLSIFVILPFRAEEFHFKLTYLLFLIGPGIPVYLLFSWKPLKQYTLIEQPISQPVE